MTLFPPRPSKPIKFRKPRAASPYAPLPSATSDGWQPYDRRRASPVHELSTLLLVPGDADVHFRLAQKWDEMHIALPSMIIGTYLLALSTAPDFDHAVARDVTLRRIGALKHAAMTTGPSVRERMPIARLLATIAAYRELPELTAEGVELGLTVTCKFDGKDVTAMEAAARYAELIVLGSDYSQWGKLTGYLPYERTGELRRTVAYYLRAAVPKMSLVTKPNTQRKSKLGFRLIELAFDANPPMFKNLAMLRARKHSLPEPEVWVDVGIPKPFKTSQVRAWLNGPVDVHLVNTPA
jgi:hypothetical protein